MVYQVQEISQFLLGEERKRAERGRHSFLLHSISGLYYIQETKSHLRLCVNTRHSFITMPVKAGNVLLFELLAGKWHYLVVYVDAEYFQSRKFHLEEEETPFNHVHSFLQITSVQILPLGRLISSLDELLQTPETQLLSTHQEPIKGPSWSWTGSQARNISLGDSRERQNNQRHHTTSCHLSASASKQSLS